MKIRFLLIFVVIFSFATLEIYPASWKITDRFNYQNYQSIDNFDSLHCLAIGNIQTEIPCNRVTSDGGKTWTTTFTDPFIIDSNGKLEYQPPRMYLVRYLNLRTCYLLGDTGYYWASVDSCKTWKKGKLPSKYQTFGVNFLDDKDGIITTGGDAFKTTDAGMNWEKMLIPDSIFNYNPHGFGPVFLFPPKIIIFLCWCSSHPNIVRSDDFGLTWKGYPPIDEISDAYFLDSLTGFAAGGKHISSGIYSNLIYRTDDGGKTWFKQLDTLVNPDMFLNKIKFWDKNNGLAISDFFNLWLTHDGGNHWYQDTTFQASKPVWYLTDAVLIGPNTIIGVTDNSDGAIYKYSDEFDKVKENLLISGNNDIVIYPDPSNGEENLNIRFNFNYSLEIKFSIINSFGEILDEHTENYLSPGVHTIRYQPQIKLNPGVYFLKIENDGKSQLKPFVIVK